MSLKRRGNDSTRWAEGRQRKGAGAQICPLFITYGSVQAQKKSGMFGSALSAGRTLRLAAVCSPQQATDRLFGCHRDTVGTADLAGP